MEPSTELRKLEHTETNAFITSIAIKMMDVGLAELELIDPSQRFVLWSRILTFMYSNHFKITINATKPRPRNDQR